MSIKEWKIYWKINRGKENGEDKLHKAKNPCSQKYKIILKAILHSKDIHNRVNKLNKLFKIINSDKFYLLVYTYIFYKFMM